jgi:hypothetical protein
MRQTPFRQCYVQVLGRNSSTIMYLDALGSVKELIVYHPKLSSKVSLGIHQIRTKVFEHESIVPINSQPLNPLTLEY